jgi:hypothetical protein
LVQDGEEQHVLFPSLFSKEELIIWLPQLQGKVQLAQLYGAVIGSLKKKLPEAREPLG